MDERSPLLSQAGNISISSRDTQTTSHTHITVYKRRWWILTVFCLLSLNQGLLWNTWSPIGDAMLIGFGWKDSFLALCLWTCCIAVAVISFPAMYMIETRGLGYCFVASCL